MPRLIAPAVLMTIVLLSATPGAAAKEITAMKVCGADRCAQVKRATAQRWHENGGLEGAAISPAPRRVPYYRVTTFVGEPGGDAAGQFSLAFIPRLDAVLPLEAEPPAPWMRVAGPVATQLARVTEGITPLPAKRLEAAAAEFAGGALPPKVYEPAGATRAGDGGVSRPLLAGVPAILILGFGLGLVVLRRRRMA